MRTPKLLSLIVMALLLTSSVVVTGQPCTAFTYQGRLFDGGIPANGLYDLQFTNYSAATGGAALGGYNTNAVPVSNGLFTVTLDFGAVFDGNMRWLELSERINGADSFSTLTPRQCLAAAPYAIYAATAGTVGAMPGLTIQQNTSGAPNVIAGSPVNYVDGGVVGATIGGGGATNWLGRGSYTNCVLGDLGTVSGGGDNTARGYFATVGGGAYNTAWFSFAMVGGGVSNIASGTAAAVAGGQQNTAKGEYSAVGGGANNLAYSYNSTIGGGNTNSAYGENSTVGGGYGNTADAIDTTVAGGAGNMAGGSVSTVGGGETNGADGDYSTVGGGNGNLASGDYSAVPGGAGNVAGGVGSFAVGQAAKAMDDGSFVWNDNSAGDLSSAAPNTVTMRASGGYQLYSGKSSGVSLAAGSGSWTSMSDRNAKENFAPVDAQALLEKVSALPLSTWNYKSQDPAVRHLGPMAQDFKAAFNVGESDTGITTVDADGVALAAIQGLNQKLEQQNAAMEKQLAARNAEIQALKESVAELRETVARASQTPK